MNVGAKLAGFAVALAATFGLGWAIGSAIEPVGGTEVDDEQHHPSPPAETLPIQGPDR